MILQINKEDAVKTLTDSVIKGAHRRYGEHLTKEQTNRINMELGAIFKAGREKYFLIVGDIVRRMREVGVSVGTGHGPSVGSVVCYCLNITGIDPLQYGLSFDRYFHYTDNTAIWLQFDSKSREGIIKHLVDDYGKHHVARIVHPDTPDKAGVYRTSVVLCDKDIEEVVPTKVVKDFDLGKDILAVQCPRLEVESKGLYRVEYIGLSVLEIVGATLERIRQNYGNSIDMEHIQLDDEATMRLIQEGNTTGVFQFECPMMKEYLPKIKPQSFVELVAMNAICRMKSQSENTMNEYLLRKQGKHKAKYLHPCLERILNETYGLLIYDEQMMQIAQPMAGIAPQDCSRMYHALHAKEESESRKYEQMFFCGGLHNGYSKEILQTIWDMSQNAINKAHVVSEVWMGYQTAYLKAHHMAEYMTEVVRFRKSIYGETDIAELLEDCRSNGLNVKKEVRGYRLGNARKGKKRESIQLKFITVTKK